MERVYTISICELRLFLRDRQRLLAAASLPILAGLLFGLAARATGLSSLYGFVLTLTLSALLPLVPQSIPMSDFPTARRLRYAARAVSRLMILSAQAVIYLAIMLSMGTISLPIPEVVVGTIVLSSAIGLTAERLGNNR